MGFHPDTPSFDDPSRLDPIVLVHGAWHSPAVWEPVARLLRERGYHVVVPELPIDATEAGALDHAEVIAAACADLISPVIVAHTSASLSATLVPSLISVGRLVHVNGVLPQIGSSFTDQPIGSDLVLGANGGRRYDRDARSFWVDQARFAELLAADCDAMTVARLWRQLRPQAQRTFAEVTPLARWPQTPTSAILYCNDAELPIEWLRRITLERLGVEPIEIPGSQLGFNARPRSFVKTLSRLLAPAAQLTHAGDSRRRAGHNWTAYLERSVVPSIASAQPER